MRNLIVLAIIFLVCASLIDVVANDGRLTDGAVRKMSSDGAEFSAYMSQFAPMPLR